MHAGRRSYFPLQCISQAYFEGILCGILRDARAGASAQSVREPNMWIQMLHEVEHSLPPPHSIMHVAPPGLKAVSADR
jgi:hypothetical protein